MNKIFTAISQEHHADQITHWLLLHFSCPHPQITLTKWDENHGNISSVHFGSEMAVVLNDYETIKVGFVDQAEAFSGRPYTFVFEVLLNNSPRNVGQAEGASARDQRRFLLKSFRDLGVSISRLEQFCLEEAESLVLLLVRYPHVQSKLSTRSGLIGELHGDDRASLPYADSALQKRFSWKLGVAQISHFCIELSARCILSRLFYSQTPELYWICGMCIATNGNGMRL